MWENRQAQKSTNKCLVMLQLKYSTKNLIYNQKQKKGYFKQKKQKKLFKVCLKIKTKKYFKGIKG